MGKEINISNLSKDTGDGITVSNKAEVLKRKLFLNRKMIGISISESDNLNELGYGVAHLKDAIIEIARYILVSGGKLAYGGDMRQGGFTELIFDLLAYYRADNTLAPHERFYSYLAYPISTTLTKEKEAELSQTVSFRKIAPPRDISIADSTTFLSPDSPENLYVWTRCLTQMREAMETSCDARIFVGGRARGFKGKYPGILEEFFVAIQHNHPVYLVGAFGGITKDIIDALSNKTPASLSDEYRSLDADYAKMIDIFNQKHPQQKISYALLLSTLQNMGLATIAKRNGLSEEENLRLTLTPHISEMIYLILKGLTKTFNE